MADLKFDVDKISEMKRLCDNSCAELDTLNSDLNSKLEELKKQWNTPAGDKFFQDLSDDWSDQVAQYKKITSAISSLLEEAITQYTSVEEAANNLKFS